MNRSSERSQKWVRGTGIRSKNRFCEDKETLRQLQKAQVDFDVMHDNKDCDHEIADGSRENSEHPGD